MAVAMTLAVAVSMGPSLTAYMAVHMNATIDVRVDVDAVQTVTDAMDKTLSSYVVVTINISAREKR